MFGTDQGWENAVELLNLADNVFMQPRLENALQYALLLPLLCS
jgi:hypothetical protein